MRKKERLSEEEKRRETVPWVFNGFEHFWEGDFGILMLVERERRNERDGNYAIP